MHIYLFLIISSVLYLGCKFQKKSNLDVDPFAWCIVHFDESKRNPEKRIEMLKELNLSKYAYDEWDFELDDMVFELQHARENQIEVVGLWMWVDDSDSSHVLRPNNRKVFDAIAKSNYKGEVWVGFNPKFCEGLNDEEAFNKSYGVIKRIVQTATNLGCKVALYNHSDWLGFPKNQVKMIESFPASEIGIVYSCNHAREQVNTFEEDIPLLLPYLWHVNLSGINKEGPRTIPLGEGKYEHQLFTILMDNNYQGDFGILGTTKKSPDVKPVLEENIERLENFISKYQKK